VEGEGRGDCPPPTFSLSEDVLTVGKLTAKIGRYNTWSWKSPFLFGGGGVESKIEIPSSHNVLCRTFAAVCRKIATCCPLIFVNRRHRCVYTAACLQRDAKLVLYLLRWWLWLCCGMHACCTASSVTDHEYDLVHADLKQHFVNYPYQPLGLRFNNSAFYFCPSVILYVPQVNVTQWRHYRYARKRDIFLTLISSAIDNKTALISNITIA